MKILEEFCSHLKNSKVVEIIPIKYGLEGDKRNTDEAIQLALAFYISIHIDYKKNKNQNSNKIRGLAS